jgi:hypothetical protein
MIENGRELEPRLLTDIVVLGIGRLTGHEDWVWGQLAQKAAEREPLRLGVAVLDAVERNPNLHMSTAEGLRAAFESCLRHERETLGKAVLDRVVTRGKYDPMLLHLVEETFLQHVDFERVLRWASEHGEAGQVVLAKMLHAGPSPQTIRALEHFGARSALASVLAASYGSGAFGGDPADVIEDKANRAETWADNLAYPKAFREWASSVADRERAHAQSWRQHQQEQEVLQSLETG